MHADTLHAGSKALSEGEAGAVLVVGAVAYGVVAEGHHGVADVGGGADSDGLVVGVGASAFGCVVADAKKGQIDDTEYGAILACLRWSDGVGSLSLTPVL
ncbi:hypothetical protein GCM10023107_70300 [Actinoplanes octamycinicus]|nr:hypothetical protein Aoc01nite_27190 [Actinoplanes octamycinicus]